MTIHHSQRAWQDNSEPPDHDEPTLRDRLEAMPHEDLLLLVLDIADDGQDSSDVVEDLLQEWERDTFVSQASTP